MRKLAKLWQAFESIPGLATTPAYWEHHCGSDYPIVRPFLIRTELIGATYPCDQQCIPGCYRDIIEHGGEILAVCYHRFFKRPDIRLTRADTVVHQLDVSAFAKAVSRPLGFRWHAAVERANGAWAIGFTRNADGIEQPLVLLVHTEQDRFQSALHRLLADFAGGFSLLAPTIRHKDIQVHETLTRHEIPFCSLEERVGVDNRGRFVSIQPLVSAETNSIPMPKRASAEQHSTGPSRSIGTKAAVDAVIAFMHYRGLSQTQFAILAQTNERTIRKFLQTGKIRRSTFEDMAAGIGITKDQLLRGELPLKTDSKTPFGSPAETPQFVSR